MKALFVFILFFAAFNCSAQRQVSTRYLAWAGVYGQYNFTPELNVHLDLQARNEFTDGDWFNWLIRTGVSFKTNNDIQLSAGIAYFKLYPNPNGLPPRPEWRPWQEVGKKFEKNKHSLYPRFRIEQRFTREYALHDLEDKFSFSVFRWRFRLDYIYNFKPEKSKGALLLAGYEYLFVTKPGGNSYFDQNRLTVGMGYRLNKYLTIQLTYLHLLMRKSSDSFEQHHISRFTLLLQFFKQEKPKQ